LDFFISEWASLSNNNARQDAGENHPMFFFDIMNAAKISSGGR
jgi:hypothetical protein